MNFGERLPTFMYVVQAHILDDAQKGGRGWLENASPLEMAVEESPLAPYEEALTANRDRRSALFAK
jgi:hypothetical protein